MDKKRDMPREMVKLFLEKIAVSLAMGERTMPAATVAECEQLCEVKMREVADCIDSYEAQPSDVLAEAGATALYEALGLRARYHALLGSTADAFQDLPFNLVVE